MKSHQNHLASTTQSPTQLPSPRRGCRRSKTRSSCQWCPSPVHALGKSPPALDAHPVARWDGRCKRNVDATCLENIPSDIIWLYVHVYIYIHMYTQYLSIHIYIYMYLYIQYIYIHWLQMSVQGRLWFDFFPVSVNLPISKKSDHCTKKTYHFMFSCWVMLSLPGISAFFPGVSALFPGISAQKNRHIIAQRRVRSAQEVGNTRLTTAVKKWPFPSLSQEIRPKGRNLANGHLTLCPFEDPGIQYIWYDTFQSWEGSAISTCTKEMSSDVVLHLQKVGLLQKHPPCVTWVKV